MKYFVTFFILLFPSLVFSFEYPIRDTGTIKVESQFNEEIGKDVSVRKFYSTDKVVKSSNLKGSTAKVVNCPNLVIESVNTSLNKSEHFRNMFSGQFIDLDKCVEVDYAGKSYFVVQIEIEIVFSNTKNRILYEPIVQIVYPNNLLYPVVLNGISQNRFFDDMRGFPFEIESISDIDNDGQHEIIIKSGIYEGYRISYFDYENGSLVQK